MSDSVTLGNTPSCAECCDTLIASNRGAKRHEYILEVCAIDAEDAITHGETPARARAWAKVYGKSPYNDATAGRRLGTAKPYRNESKAAWQAAHESYQLHHGPASQEIAERQEVAQSKLLDRVEGISRLDIADLFYPSSEGESDPWLDKLVRRLFYGMERKGAAGAEDHELFESGVRHSYSKGHDPPTAEESVALCRRVGPDRLRPLSELKELGFSKHISGWKQDRYGAQVTIEYKENRKLEAQMTNMLSRAVNLVDLQRAQDRYEDAIGEALALRCPEAKDDSLVAALWILGIRVQLTAGEGRVTRGEGETLHWDGERWVVEVPDGHLRLVESS